ncbi:MAG: site-specific DNA-methyltransferase [Planctomycetes bacterium]|nr:site-specific DNA-methyltransferase [Planctomycetota bacterium]
MAASSKQSPGGKGRRKSRRRKRSGSSTSAFGTPKREGHDSSTFYASKLYRGMNAETQPASGTGNPLPSDMRNRILCASSENMHHLPGECVHLMVTSPPYNVGKEYDEDLSLREYLGLLTTVCAEVRRVLVPGGRACINVANVGRKPYIPLHLFIVELMLDLGFAMRGEIIWDKSASAGTSTAWGSWKSPANPTLRDVHEYVLVFSKGPLGREAPDGRSATVSKEDFLELTRSVWSFPAVSARKIGHPAPFPVELPRRLIELYTFSDEVVLDPFMGSGQTAVAAVATGRVFVGYEKNPDYFELALKRTRNAPTAETG